MTGKERAEFRRQANTLTAIFQIGKGEISDAMLDSIDEALEKRELIKISVLETADLSAKDAAEMISAATGSEVIQCIGRKFVLYRKKQEQ
ncbi:MAG: YhbY family RNA-binding protein [Clostridia bacterium]|nr:YhbY family RNA-binding protein [Clostridia bacterium]MBQ3663070.1 YhbY family RNA-binding protein [Clostridia bacterium]